MVCVFVDPFTDDPFQFDGCSGFAPQLGGLSMQP